MDYKDRKLEVIKILLSSSIALNIVSIDMIIEKAEDIIDFLENYVPSVNKQA